MNKELTDLDYHIGLSECECDSPHPIGGCVYCDLTGVKKKMVEMQKQIDELMAFTTMANDTAFRTARDGLLGKYKINMTFKEAVDFLKEAQDA